MREATDEALPFVRVGEETSGMREVGSCVEKTVVKTLKLPGLIPAHWAKPLRFPTNNAAAVEVYTPRWGAVKGVR
jgi:hypothetical protein